MKGNKKSKPAIDPNLSKVIKMHEKHGRKISVNESETKYSALLLDLVKPYQKLFPGLDELDWLLNLGLIAWNLANVKKEVPGAFLAMLQDVKKEMDTDKQSMAILDKLISDKEKKYPVLKMFLHDFTLDTTDDGQLFITVTAKPLEDFLKDNLAEEDDDDLFEETEGYINRNAFIVKPLQPFLDWLNQLGGPQLFPVEIEENTIYLIREMASNNDIEKWLKKNFETIFAKELEDWDEDENVWPKNRTYKMFCQWFSVEMHSMLYDLEQGPVEKDM